MIRKLLASTAMLALMTAGTYTAQAQDNAAPAEEPAVILEQPAPDAATDETAADPAAPDEATTDTAAEEMTTEEATTDTAAGGEEKLTPEEPTLATAFIGRSVFSSEDPESDNIGEVNDLIIDDDGAITHAVVGVGGFLGIGEKDVAVPFEELEVVEREGDIRLVYAATKEQLEAAEAFDRTAYDPGERFAEEQAAMAPATDPTAPAGGVAPAPAPEEDLTAAPAEPMTAPETEADTAEADATAPAETETETATADATAPAEGEEPAVEGENLAAAPESDQGDMTAETEAPADQLAATEAPAKGEPAAEAPADATAAADTEATTDGETFLSFSADQIRASTMLGQEVYSSEDESIGEISDLVLQEDGETRAAIVDVGGFLGVGEKSIAIPFDQIEVQEEDGVAQKLTIAMSRAEIEQAPAFEMPAEDVAATDAAAPDATAPADATADATAPDAEGEMATAEVTEGEPAADVPEGVGVEVAAQDLSAEDLIGTAVKGSNDENIGEVGDVIFAESGDIEAVVVDVGGFLGVGEKPVAVEFDALNVQKDTNGDFRLMLNATQEQLEGAPAYQEEEQPAAVQ